MVDSMMWGGGEREISQGHGVPGFRPDWYEYSKDLGYPAGYHLGLDIPMPTGTPIYALSYGTVIQEGFSNSFRPYPVWIETKDNPQTPEDESGYIEIYGHLSAEVVNKGQPVTPGMLIGYSGEQTYQGTTTPDGSGPHIHFELRQPTESGAYKAIDPTGWLEGNGAAPQESGGGGGSGASGVLGSITDTIGEMGRRLTLVAVGLILVWVGLDKLMKVHTGFSPTKSVKKGAKLAVTKGVSRGKS